MMRCPVTVTWVELDMTARCLLPEGHDLPHTDGVFWFDAYGLRTPRDERSDPETAADHVLADAGERVVFEARRVVREAVRG
jgi:hypothetical protein